MAQALTHWLENLGIVQQTTLLYNPDRSHLITEAILNGEGELTHEGALNVITTPHTGRSPKDKFIVDYKDCSDIWWRENNQRISSETFVMLKNKIGAYLNNRKLYIIDCHIGADIDFQRSVRVVAEYAWQALAAQNLFIYDGTTLNTDPDITILAAPGLNSKPEIDDGKLKPKIAIDLRKNFVLIAGSKYAGEIKKAAFTIMNGILPKSGVFPMHCSANVGENSDVALFFGLSGTGKTTLSSTPDRKLIGDDEHGWGENGVFNFEGGCYAKTIRLKPDLEPVIWQAVNQFGTVLENVYISPKDRKADFADTRFTENTRAAYPLNQVDNFVPEGIAGHPTNIFFLTADAFGVMPPIAKLDHAQAVYYFLSGYTSKVAGTERGLGNKPIATFSTCFAEPFLPLTPNIYARLLQEKISTHKSNVWLINTGWTGGDYNTGRRMPLQHTRRMVNWILSGEHKAASYHKDPIFEIAVPNSISGIPAILLRPEKTWEDSDAFREVANSLKNEFENNFEQYQSNLQVANY